MGIIICCENKSNLCKNQLMKVENECEEKENQMNHNNTLKLNNGVLKPQTTIMKHNSIKQSIIQEFTNNRVKTLGNGINNKILNKIKNKGGFIEKNRKTFAISWDESYKSRYYLQKNVSNNTFNLMSASSLISQKKSILPSHSVRISNQLEEMFKKLKGIPKEKVNPNLQISTRKSTAADYIKKNKHPPIKEINKQLSDKQKEMVIKVLKYNELIDSEMPESFINMILNSITYRRLKDGVIFFDETQKDDIFYIIEKGKLEYGIDDEIFELPKLHGICTQALLKYKDYSCYIKTIGRTYLFVLPLEKYRKTVANLKKKRNEEKLSLLKEHFFFKNIDESILMNLVSMSDTIIIEEKKVILEEDSLSNHLYYIISGTIEILKKGVLIKTINEGNIFGEIGLFSQIESFYEYVAQPNSSLIEISFDNIVNCLGEKYVQNIVYQIYINAIKNDEFLSFISTDKIIERVFPLFQLKFYFHDTILSKNQKKLILPISGSVIKSKFLAKDIKNFVELISQLPDKNFLKHGVFFTDSITMDVDISYNLIGDEAIVFECEWEAILPKLIQNNIFRIFNIQPFELIQILKQLSLFKYLSEFKLFQIINSFKEKRYGPGQIILKDGPKSNFFYFIFNGEVKININGVDFKTLTNGKCFGDISSEEKKFSQITDFISKTNSIIFLIEKDTYNDIVNKSDFFLNLRKMINLNDANITLYNLYYLQNLGFGSYGQVFLVHNKKKLFAFKTAEIYRISVNKEEAQSYINEKTIMQQVQHPFIVHLNNTFKTKDYIFFIMEFVNGMNLRKYLELKHKNKLRDLEEIRFFGGILFNVLHYLTQRKIIHRDIKPDNLMMDSNGYIKLIDFGVAKYLMKDYTNSIIGTPHYMSPEVIMGKPYSFNVDYWSTGIVLYEIFYGRVPFGFATNDTNEIYKEIINSNLILPSDIKNESFNNLLNLLLNKNSSVRISNFTDIKNHSFFKNFDFECLLNFKYESHYKPPSMLEKSEEELLKDCTFPIMNYLKNHIYQSLSDVDEDFLIKSINDDLFLGF